MELVTGAVTALDALSADFEAMLQDSTFADVIFKVGERETPFHAHRAVLCARSRYFGTLFASGFRETSSHDDGAYCIRKPSAEPDAFGGFLRFLYTVCVVVLAATRASVVGVADIRIPGAHRARVDG